MDNRVNKIRKKISELRLHMLATERAMRKDVALRTWTARRPRPG